MVVGGTRLRPACPGIGCRDWASSCRASLDGQPRAAVPTYSTVAADRGIALARGSEAAGAGWRLAHSVEQVLEHDGVVILFVLRGKQKRKAFSLLSEDVEFLQFSLGVRMT